METASRKCPSLRDFAPRRYLLALAYAGLGACSGSGHAVGGTGGVRADGSNACGSPTCAVATPTCGIYGDACGNPVNCGICSFATTTGSVQADGFSVATTTSGALEVAYAPSGGGVNIGHFANGAWTDEVALAADVATFPSHLHLAIAPDGTRWLSFVASSTSLLVAHAPEGGAWTDDGLVAPAPAGSLALGSNGTAFAIYTAVAPPSGVFVAQMIGSTWSPERVVAGASASTQVAIAVAGTQPMVVYTSNSGVVTFAQRDPTGWTTSPLSSNGYGIAVLEMTASAHGDPAVVMVGDNLEVYRRSGATWGQSTISNPNARSAAVAFDSNDNLWFASGGNQMYLGNLTANATPIQRVHRNCSGTGVGLAFDAAGNVQMIDTCPGSIEVHTRQGSLSADDTNACNQIVSTLCTRACSCTGIANCCYFPGSASWCSGTMAGCQYDIMLHLCGDVAADTTTLSTCRQALPQTTCTTQSNELGAALPAACSALY
jgi:hypothetical protein